MKVYEVCTVCKGTKKTSSPLLGETLCTECNGKGLIARIINTYKDLD